MLLFSYPGLKPTTARSNTVGLRLEFPFWRHWPQFITVKDEDLNELELHFSSTPFLNSSFFQTLFFQQYVAFFHIW